MAAAVSVSPSLRSAAPAHRQFSFSASGLRSLLLLRGIMLVIATSAELPACPKPSENIKSSSKAGAAVKIEFHTDLESELDVYWIDPQSVAHYMGPISKTSRMRQNSFEGHAFRVFASSVLLSQYIVTSEGHQEVAIKSCGDLNLDGIQAVDRTEEFEALRHGNSENNVVDGLDPCTPVGRSDLWSCVRKIPKTLCDQRHHNDKHASQGETFGFEATYGKWSVGAFEDLAHDRQVALIPTLSKGPGFLKMNMTKQMAELLLPWYAEGEREGKVEVESIVPGGYVNDQSVRSGHLPVEHTPGLRQKVVNEMQQVLQWWTKQTLEHTATYGARVYRRGAVLLNHLDRRDTHLASAVIQVAQTTDKDAGWPLEIISDDRDCYEVYLQPGEMVLYEGAHFKHGRPMQFRGDAFVNIFTHFRPIGFRDPFQKKEL